jgi:signal transduction histidine kinase
MDPTGDVWAALRGNPLRFLASSWPWRSLAYLASSALVGMLTLVGLFVIVGVGALTAVLVVGLVVLGSLPLVGLLVGALERRRLPLMQPGAPALPPAYAVEPGASLRDRLRAARRTPASARELGYAVLLAVVLWWVDAVVAFNAVLVPGVFLLSPLLATYDQVALFGWTLDSPGEAAPIAAIGGPLTAVAAAYVVTTLAGAQAALARILVNPSEARLAARVEELDRSRTRLVDAFEIERRRIERDLHDGVQLRLVGLTMTLGMAELDAPEGPTLELLRRAHREAEACLDELRATVRGIHPRVLVDHGLAAAVHEVADRSPVPVQVDIALPERLPGPVEAAAYFVVSEALTNAARHAHARHVGVQGVVHDGRLVVSVTDDGVGGASVEGGTGLAGLVTRLDALHGTLSVSSPPGGPTVVRMECGVSAGA